MPNTYWTYFDEAWKKVIERFFPQFLAFFVPELYADVDFSKGFTFLDKEMEQIAQQSFSGSKFVDKLVQVYLRDGGERWLLVHIEVQAEADEEFSLRMFRYFYRGFDRYAKPIVSIAILASPESETATGTFELMEYGSGVAFQYLTRKLMQYDSEALEKNDNPIALVVLAAQERERHRRKRTPYNVKWGLIRKALERGYEPEEIIALLEFIDWVLRLPDDEEDRLWEEITTYQEEKKMPYITSFERIGIRKGLQQGLQQMAQQMVVEVLDERFGEVPSPISDAIGQIEDSDLLRNLHRQAIRSASLEDFQQLLNGQSPQ